MTSPHPAPLRRHCARALLLCSAVLWSACASRPSPTLLSLPVSPAPVLPSSTAPAQGAPVLVVRRMVLPEYLLSRRVRYRADASTLAEWPDTVWAERIEVAASRELLATLRQALPGWTVCEPGCVGSTPAAQVVSLRAELTTLDFSRTSSRLTARALVTLESAGQPTRQHTMADDIVALADTPQAHAQAVAELLQRLGLFVAERLK